MRAMVLDRAGVPLVLREVPDPTPGRNEVLLRVRTCGVCRTDLHIQDGDLPGSTYPIIPGHQIVGDIIQVGDGVSRFRLGDRVGVPWLGATCGSCVYCRGGQENLCDRARFTGFHRDGGFAEMSVADQQFCFPIPPEYPALSAAPLLCAGLIGYRAYRMIGEAKTIGFYGFGSAAHILLQVALHQGRRVLAFTRPGDGAAQRFATDLGATWAGGSSDVSPEPLDAAIIFAPVGALVPLALRAVRKGGTVVCAGIHMSDIPAFPYADLWNEKVLRSVANLTRRDGEEFVALAPTIPIRTIVRTYVLTHANEALDDLREGRLEGSAVLQIAEQNRRA